jgi:hypothetical protein
VLGEVHTGMQTLTSLFADLHGDPGELVRARQSDLGRPLIGSVEPRAGALRSDNANAGPDDVDIEIGDARSWRDKEHVLAVAELVVEDREGRLVVRSRDGSRVFDLVEVLEPHLILASATHFHLLPPAHHLPRVVIDGLVVGRETWSFEPSELAFTADHGFERFVAARRWARARGLPRFVFVRVPSETKPCFVDFESPIFIDMLVRLIRGAPIVKVSEMLPAVDQTWLNDADRRSYTSELRITLVDPEPWRPM